MLQLFPIIKGEAVSHWLARVSAATGINPAHLVDNLGTLTTQAGGPRTIAHLEKKLLKNDHSIFSLHHPLAQYPDHIRQSLTRFIPTLGPRGHISGGASYCPYCLKEGLPFMASWQNTLLTVCTKHWTPMQSLCPKCNAFVNYVLSFKRHGTSTVCHQCETKLDTNLPAIHIQESNLQRTLFDCLHGTLAAPAGSDADVYVSGINTVIKYLRGHFSQLALEEIATQMDLPNNYGGYTRQKEFNKQSLAWRRIIVNLSIWLSLDWPNRFDQILNKTSPNVSHSERPKLNW